MRHGWTARAWEISDSVVWIVKLSFCWWLLALVGVGLFGIGPATASGAILVRRRSRGETVGFRDAIGIYRREFISANLAFAPALLLTAVLLLNLSWFSGLQLAAPKLFTLGALCLLAVAGCYLGPLYAFYHLPRTRYLIQAIRITLARPLWSVLLALVTAAIIFACSKFPLVIPLAVGVWLHACSWLGLRFFTENEDRRTAAAAESSEIPARESLLTLPTQPLRLH